MKTINFTCISLTIGLMISCSQHKNEPEIALKEEIAVEEAHSPEQAASYHFTPPHIDADYDEDLSEGLKPTSEIIETVSQEQNKQSNFIVTHAASILNFDNKHKLIKNVNMKFKVDNVPEATYIIENITLKNLGHIRRSHIDNRQSYSSTVNISKDSAIIIHHDNLSADIQLRVHYSRLDTVLKEIAPLATKIDYRTIDVNDVTINLLAEKLKRERMGKKQKRISAAIDNKGRKLDDILQAEYAVDRAAEEADNAFLSDYSINDQIEYSTINIRLYQNETQYREKVLREKQIEEYSPSFTDNFASAIRSGWSAVTTVFIVLMHIWPLYIIGIVAAIIIWRYRKKKNSQ